MPELLTITQCAQVFGVSVRTIQRWIKAFPDFPPACRITQQTKRYASKDIAEWMRKKF